MENYTLAAGTTFELLKFMQSDAMDIIAARTRAQLIHATSDIKMAGNEVEAAVRSLLKKRLSVQHYVGHGHVVDSRWKVSRQHDVIIADGVGATVLFRGQDGAEYLPFDSTYAVGEIKSTYRRSEKQIHGFVDALAELHHSLSRERAPIDYAGNGLILPGLTDSRTYKNPLFTFMVFVDAGDFAVDDIRELYRSTPVSKLPNIICFINRGNVLYITQLAGPPPGAFQFDHVPELRRLDSAQHPNGWALIEPDGQSQEGSALCMFYGLLTTHLVTCKLLPLLPMDYYKQAINNFRLMPIE